MRVPHGCVDYVKHKNVIDRVTAPVRDVVRVLEVVGPKGGVLLVHVLECTHWMTRRSLVKRVACISCAVENTLRREERL